MLNIVATVLALLACSAVCQDVGFALDGAIESATATDSSFNTGGYISVNGWKVLVPQNLQVGFPAAWIPWKDFVAAWNTAIFKEFEVSVVGNVVTGAGPIAGQIYVSQFFTQASQGFISQVNNDGTMKITNGPTIRINDPNAVYSAGYSGSPFMTADDQNPSISSFSGFPMCVPRSTTDALCPASNRPTLAGGTKQGTLTAPDPLVMAPFVAGDYIEYSGYFNDAGEIICYSIVATNIQITTGGSPTYIRMEDANVGVFSADPNAEVADTKFIGFTSDTAGSPLTVSAMEVDVCTGKQTLRPVTTANIIAGAVRNKFDVRLKSQAGDKYAREYLITTASAPKLTKNNITAGQYVQPVTEWIQPELTAPGLAPLPNAFSGFVHLTHGLGPDSSGNVWGPLNPFPQTGVTVFNLNSCPPVTPPTPSTTASTTATASPTASATVIVPDLVKVTLATWTSSGGGTLSVTCTSNNTNSALVGMVLDYKLLKEGTTSFSNAMTASTTTLGTWTYSSVKIKQATTVTCRSKLGGNSTLAVTAR